MKLALFSDLHANLHAFESCLEDAQARGATDFAILGDMVGYGPHPNEVLDLCRRLQAEGALVLRGNHEDMAVSPPPNKENFGDLTAHWTHRTLSETNLRWIRQLPLTGQIGAVFLVHASADAPLKWRYVQNPILARLSLEAACAQSPSVRYVCGGHVHHQSLYYMGQSQSLMRFDPVPGSVIPVPSHRRWIATVGSVGQPRDGDPRAAYALLDIDRKELVFHRIEYDQTATADDIRAAGLPEALAIALEHGA